MEEFIQFLSETMNRLYNGASGSYKEALEDVTDNICEYLETRGHQINLTPITEKYMTSKKHREIQRFNDFSLEEQVYRFFKERGEDINLEDIILDSDIKKYCNNIYQTGIDSAFRDNGIDYNDDGLEIHYYDEILTLIKEKKLIHKCVFTGGCDGCPFDGTYCT